MIPANSPSGINVPDLTMAGCSKNDGRSIQPDTPFYSVRVRYHGQQGLIPGETCMLYLSGRNIVTINTPTELFAGYQHNHCPLGFFCGKRPFFECGPPLCAYNFSFPNAASPTRR